MPALSFLDPLLQQLLGTVLLSFLVGLEFHRYMREKGHLGFGTTRTLTLFGLLGFVLAALDHRYGTWLLPVGLLLLAGWLGVYYAFQVRQRQFSLMGPMVALLTFLIGPVMLHFPSWFWLLYVIIMILLLSQKPLIRSFSDLVPGEELLTLAKFLLMAGVVLPLLPDRQIAPFVPVTWYQVWMAVVVISGVSYFSYLAQTWILPKQGLLLGGLLGGLYSSTATTWLLARRLRDGANRSQVRAAVVLATASMYLRLLIVIAVLAPAVALDLLLPFGILLAGTLGFAWLLLIRGRSEQGVMAGRKVAHPLELSTALLFAGLFVLFSALTHFAVDWWGTEGLNRLAFLSGLSDVDPFVLSVLSGDYPLERDAIVDAIMVASGGNNLLKAAYVLLAGRGRALWPASLWLAGLCAVSLTWALV